MADENKETPETAEFEETQHASASNKDVWLFLIIVDVVFLCVFGFFLYKNLSARLLSPAAGVKNVAAVQQGEPEEEEVITAEAALPEVTAPDQMVSSVFALPENRPAETAQPEPAPQPKAQPKAPAGEAAAAKPAEQKESVLVKTNPKSKYRQVTFRYFGEGKNVAVVSGFTMAKPRALKKKKDYWETTLAIAPGTYKYLFVVDGTQMTDPYAEQKDGRSLLVIK